MRTSHEIEKIFMDKGMVVFDYLYGTSYRAGGAILIAPEKEMIYTQEDSTIPCVIKKAKIQAFNGTGYDGRGRYYDIFMFSAPSDEQEGMTRISKGEFCALKEEDRFSITSEKSGNIEMFFGYKSKDTFGDLSELFEGLGL